MGQSRNEVSPDLLDTIEPTPVGAESGADLVRAALREAAAPAALITLIGADPASGAPLTNVAEYTEPVEDLYREVHVPDPSGLDEFVDPGKATDAVAPATVTPPWRTSAGADLPLRITEPGVYQLAAHEYHDPAVTGDWLSNSDARQLISPSCPEKFRHNRDHGVRKRSAAFDLGHAAHALVLGAGEQIVVRPAKFDSWRTKDAQRWRSEQEAAGRVVLLPEEWETVVGMAAGVGRNRWASRLLRQPGRPEVALFWVCPDTGVKRRCMIDFLPSQRSASGLLLPVDYKTCDNADPGDDMERHIYKFGYHRQATTIIDGIIALGLSESVEFYFVFQEKSAPYVSTVVRLDSDSQRIGRVENRRALDIYAECLESGVWPPYSSEPVVMGVPGYIAARYEGETA